MTTPFLCAGAVKKRQLRTDTGPERSRGCAIKKKKMKKWILTACIFIILAIVLGAFGAHGLKGKLTEDQLSSFETGVRFQMYHGLALLILPVILEKFGLNFERLKLIFIGTLIFSGSIYLLTLKNLAQIEVLGKIAGPITPIGGLILIIGWIFILLDIKKTSA